MKSVTFFKNINISRSSFTRPHILSGSTVIDPTRQTEEAEKICEAVLQDVIEDVWHLRSGSAGYCLFIYIYIYKLNIINFGCRCTNDNFYIEERPSKSLGLESSGEVNNSQEKEKSPPSDTAGSESAVGQTKPRRKYRHSLHLGLGKTCFYFVLLSLQRGKSNSEFTIIYV
jgi:hypothetical protein